MPLGLDSNELIPKSTNLAPSPGDLLPEAKVEGPSSLNSLDTSRSFTPWSPGSPPPTPSTEVDQTPSELLEISRDETVRGQLEDLLASDSLYMRQAETEGREYAAERGLLNASLGIQAAESSRIAAGYPIAYADAQTHAQRGFQRQAHLDSLRELAVGGDIQASLDFHQFTYQTFLEDQAQGHRIELEDERFQNLLRLSALDHEEAIELRGIDAEIWLEQQNVLHQNNLDMIDAGLEADLERMDRQGEINAGQAGQDASVALHNQYIIGVNGFMINARAELNQLDNTEGLSPTEYARRRTDIFARRDADIAAWGELLSSSPFWDPNWARNTPVGDSGGSYQPPSTTTQPPTYEPPTGSDPNPDYVGGDPDVGDTGGTSDGGAPDSPSGPMRNQPTDGSGTSGTSTPQPSGSLSYEGTDPDGNTVMRDGTGELWVQPASGPMVPYSGQVTEPRSVTDTPSGTQIDSRYADQPSGGISYAGQTSSGQSIYEDNTGRMWTRDSSGTYQPYSGSTTSYPTAPAPTGPPRNQTTETKTQLDSGTYTADDGSKVLISGGVAYTVDLNGRATGHFSGTVDGNQYASGMLVRQ